MPQQSTSETIWHPRPVAPRLTAVAIRAILAAATLIALLSLALADASQQDARSACRADYRSYCSDAKPGGGRIRECMTKNFDKLSDACKKAVKAETK